MSLEEMAVEMMSEFNVHIHGDNEDEYTVDQSMCH